MKSEGFTLVEVLIASSIIIVMITTFVPITTLLSYERDVLSERRTLSAKLHDELQPFLWEEKLTSRMNFMKEVNGNSVEYDFSLAGGLVKGCISWKNVKEIKETRCLYGYPQK